MAIEERNYSPAVMYGADKNVTVDLGDLLDANENELLEFDTVDSAVNYVRCANAATGSGPTFSAQGSDDNIDLNIGGKGTGGVVCSGTLDVEAGKIALNLSGGAASASGILMGVGTTASPATTAVADKMFVELRTESTATSGDSRSLYIRHSLNGAGISGEAIRAFSKVEAAAATTRGAHISLDVAATGSASGLGVGVDNQILVHDGALAGGTYAVANFEAYSAGSSTDVSAVTEFSFLRLVAGGDSTGAANVDDNAFAMTFSGVAAGSGNMIDTDITTHTAYGGLRVNIPGVGTRYIALVSA